MENKELSDFGKILMQEVRHQAVYILRGVISGKLKSESDQELHKKLMKDTVNKEVLEEFGLYIIDETIHDFLWMFEQTDEYKIIGPSGKSLAEISDGLCGELYTEDGWIAKYATDKRGA